MQLLAKNKNAKKCKKKNTSCISPSIALNQKGVSKSMPHTNDRLHSRGHEVSSRDLRGNSSSGGHSLNAKVFRNKCVDEVRVAELPEAPACLIAYDRGGVVGLGDPPPCPMHARV